MGLLDKILNRKDDDLFVQIAELLNGKGIIFRRDENDEAVFRFEADIEGKVIKCILVCDQALKLLTFVAFIPNKIPVNIYPAALELIARINEDVKYGSFQLNIKIGIISCITTLPFNNAKISFEQLERLCFNNLLHVSEYQCVFFRVLEEYLTPDELFNEIKSELSNRSN